MKRNLLSIIVTATQARPWNSLPMMGLLSSTIHLVTVSSRRSICPVRAKISP